MKSRRVTEEEVVYVLVSSTEKRDICIITSKLFGLNAHKIAIGDFLATSFVLLCPQFAPQP
jgi:hypothetical protein